MTTEEYKRLENELFSIITQHSLDSQNHSLVQDLIKWRIKEVTLYSSLQNYDLTKQLQKERIINLSLTEQLDERTS